LVLFLVGCVGAASAPGTGGKGGGTATMVLFQSDIDMQKKGRRRRNSGADVVLTGILIDPK
jgi:hypothetical protein